MLSKLYFERPVLNTNNISNDLDFLTYIYSLEQIVFIL